jgi:hypothetical protein
MNVVTLAGSFDATEACGGSAFRMLIVRPNNDRVSENIVHQKLVFFG